MAGKSKIEWTVNTWNPLVGCSILSPGCTNCYAMGEAARQIRCAAGLGRETHYAGTVKTVKGKAVWTGKLAQAPDSILMAPLRRRKPTTYFVNSMSDLFHENVPDEWIDRIFAVMALCPQHTFQVLTKRAKRMREYLWARDGMGNGAICRAINLVPNGMGNRHGALSMPLPNVWLGVSTERQQEADERIPDLLQTPAAVRFISAEPLLGPIDLNEVIPNPLIYNSVTGMSRLLDWVIVGGESGHGYRDMNHDWARSIRDQCTAAGVAVFIKQMAGKKEIPEDLRVRQFPAAGNHAAR